MNDKTIEELALDMGFELTSAAFPAEAEFYHELIDASSKPRTPSRDNPLGFGVSDGIGAAVSLLMYSAATELLKLLWDAGKPALSNLAKEGSAALTSALLERFKTWIASKFSKPAPAKLKAEDADAFVRKWVTEAERKGLSKEEVHDVQLALEKAVK